jgi:2-oxoisovalerate dehydrogenase E1 component
MNRQKLQVEFDWQRWKSSAQDVKKLLPLLGARMLFDILLINKFEHELLRLKNNDCVWGPVHSSVGQEAVAAATMAAIRKEDKITGSHRAHHQFLSKVLHHVLSPKWNPTKDELPPEGVEVVQKTLAEIMGLAPGYCGGRGGSMHLRCAEAGVLGTNAIVAGGIPLATGAAYAEKYRKTGNIIVCFFGDGAVNQGAFHEALNMAGLWKLPILYFIENNEYAVGTRSTDACAIADLSIRGAAYSMKGRIVDGADVIGIYEATRDAAERIRKGDGPYIIEAKCYRRYHHAGDQPGSAYGYRDKEEEAVWLEKDPVKGFPRTLVENGILKDEEVDRIQDFADTAVQKALEFCTVGDDHCQVREDLWPDPDTAGSGMRSDGKELEGLRYSEREDFQEFQEMKYSDAISAVTGRWMEKDDKVVVFGEEIANFGGGAYGATKGLPGRYPDRIINTPISEAGFVGITCGAAMSGMRPVVEIMFPDFTLVAADQAFNQIAKARHMYGGTTDLPLVARTRIATGCGYGGQHSMDPIGLFALFAGWRIVAPSNAFDYIGLFNTAMQSMDPVVFLEHHSLYTKRFPVPKDDLDYYIPFGKARVTTGGEDLTVLTYSSMTGRVEALIEKLETRGVSAEIIDLRTVDLVSLDYDSIGASLKKTGAIAVVEEAAGGQAIGERIAAEVTRRFFDELDGPPGILTSKNVPNSVSRILEAAAMLSDEEIVQGLVRIGKRNWY